MSWHITVALNGFAKYWQRRILKETKPTTGVSKIATSI
jgi:hypothetical protein